MILFLRGSVSGLLSATKYLKPDGWLITYGPYAIDGKLEPESNEI